MASKPVLAIVTEAIRRDVHEPLRHFKKFEIVHFYFKAPYGDMRGKEIKEGAVRAVKFNNARHLYQELVNLAPAVIQGAEPYASKKALAFSLAAQKAARKTGAKFVFPMLENRPPSARFGLLAPIVKLVLRYYSQRADLIFVLNSGAQKNLLDVGAKKAKLVRRLWGIWGVDTTLFSPKKNGKEPQWKVPVILYVGRLVEEKGIEDILNAYEKVINIVPAHLVFVGTGPMEKEIEKYRAGNKGGGKITLLGLRQQVDLPPLFRASTVSIYPSRTVPKWEEQVGTVNMQALACGTPVVSTKSGAIPEYIINGKIGLLAPEKNSQELAKNLLIIINNKKRAKQLSEAGREYALTHYDSKKNIERGEKIINELCHEQSR